MTKPSTAAHDLFGDLAPALARYTDQVMLDDMWTRPGLSPRERTLVTLASATALGQPDELRIHFALALENGIAREDLVELVTHLAFYAGFPAALVALQALRSCLTDPVV